MNFGAGEALHWISFCYNQHLVKQMATPTMRKHTAIGV
jgi:hypothetical protein